MSKEKKTNLLFKFYKHQLDDDELIQLFERMNHSDAAGEMTEEMNELWKDDPEDIPVYFDQKKILDKIKKEIHAHDKLKTETDLKVEKPERRRNAPYIRKYLKYAAAILLPLAVLTGGYFVFHKTSSEKISYANAVVPMGKKEKITLADGTKVWLNSGSKLRYPVKMGKKVRKVFLSGEAFFDVAKDPVKPFIVVANNFSVKVLGTAFDVNAYPDDNSIETVLVRGRVRIDVSKPGIKGSLNAFLVPGDRAVYKKSSDKIGVQKVNTKRFTSWLEGNLVFKETPLTEVVKRLNRWYNADIRIGNDSIKSYLYTVSFSKETLNQALSILQKMTPIEFVKSDNGIVIRQDKKRIERLRLRR